MNKLFTTTLIILFSYASLLACDTSNAILTSTTNLSATSKRVTIDLEVAFGENGSNGNTDFIGIAFPDGFGIDITSVTPNTLTSSATDGCVDAACTTLDVVGSGRTIEISQGFGDLLNDYNSFGTAGVETYTITVEFNHTSNPAGGVIYVVGMEGNDPFNSFDGQNDQLFFSFPTDIHTNIDPAPAVGFSNCGGGACSYHCTYAMTLPNPLPVELLGFRAEAEKKGIRLDWETATEIQNEKFIVEKSNDGYRFEAIGEVLGQGNSTDRIVYSFVDEKPAAGLNYYRLKQLDFDGSYTYTDIVKASFYEDGFISNISPNPIKSNMILNIQSEKSSDFNILISDMNGRNVLSFATRIEAGNNTLEYDMQGLGTGVYLLTINDGNNYRTQKIVID